ncbi:MAG: zinc-ribbon domain-containing protein [Actinomycetota bacterium]
MESSFCHKCGAPVKSANKFCKKCGSALAPAQADFNQQEIPVEEEMNGGNRRILLISVSTIALALFIIGGSFFGFRIWVDRQTKAKATAGKTASTTKQESQSSNSTKSEEVIGIETFIKDHYAKLDRGDIAGAYADFTEKKKQSMSLQEYSDFYKNHKSTEFEELNVESHDDSSAKVLVRITTVELVNGQYITSSFKGYHYLKKINGQWKDDEYDLSEVK